VHDAARIHESNGCTGWARVLALFGAVLLACPSHPSGAAIIPPEVPTPAHTVAQLSFNIFPPNPAPIEVLTFGEHQLVGPAGRLRVDSALFPSPFLHSSVVEIRDGFFGRVSATLEYEVVVVGPEVVLPDGTVVPIPVFAAVSGEVSGDALPPPLGTGSFSMKATWSITNAVSGATLDEGGIVTPQQSGNLFDSFADLVSLDLTPNRRFKVKLVTDVGVANGFTNGGIGSGRAFVDPVFSFAPDVAPEYSFVFSEGVGNLPIPEPQTFTLMAAGLLTLGFLTKRLRSGR
jgi:hypothetical protein